MASKKRKKKVQKPNLSPANYIKTKARSLPIYECLIEKNWDTMGLATIIIARKHTNGNITFGLYLVDVYCLGLKDTFCNFNVSPSEYEDLKDGCRQQNTLVNCDYALVHNIIYGAIEFANDLGFKPHKDFQLTRYILEEDDDSVEYIDIEFGHKGVPCYISGPHDDSQRIIKHLEASVGSGNFEIMDMMEVTEETEESDDGKDIEDWDDDDWERFNNGEMEVDEELLEGLIDKMYESNFKEKGGKEIDPENLVPFEYEITYDPIEELKFNTEASKKKAGELNKLVKNDANKAIPLLKEAIKEDPDNQILYNYLVNAYYETGNKRLSDELVVSHYHKFPDYLFAKLSYIDLMINQGRLDEVPGVLENKYDLQKIYPDRNKFHVSEIIAFFTIMVKYFAIKGNIKTADIYWGVLKQLGERNPSVDNVGRILRMKKLEKLGMPGLINK